jgi:hypothetical protein
LQLAKTNPKNNLTAKSTKELEENAVVATTIGKLTAVSTPAKKANSYH